MNNKMLVGIVIGLIFAVMIVSAYANSDKSVITISQYENGNYADGDIIKIYGSVTETSKYDGIGYLEMDGSETFQYNFNTFPDMDSLLYKSIVITVEYHETPLIIGYVVI